MRICDESCKSCNVLVYAEHTESRWKKILKSYARLRALQEISNEKMKLGEKLGPECSRKILSGW